MAGIDSYTKLMLHCDGSDASTTFTDDSASGHTVTANGNAQIDTAQSVFGGASGFFDGGGDYLSISDHADFDFGSGDFTIDFRVRFNALPTDGNFETFYGRDVSAHDVQLDIKNTSGTYTIRFIPYISGAKVVVNATWTTPVVDTWYHIAYVRSGTSWYVFIDGTQVGSTGSQSGTLDSTTDNVSIGRHTSGSPRELNGWLDEFRVSKGVARWTSNFTPPTEPYRVLDIADWLNGEQSFFDEEIFLPPAPSAEPLQDIAGSPETITVDKWYRQPVIPSVPFETYLDLPPTEIIPGAFVVPADFTYTGTLSLTVTPTSEFSATFSYTGTVQASITPTGDFDGKFNYTGTVAVTVLAPDTGVVVFTTDIPYLVQAGVFINGVDFTSSIFGQVNVQRRDNAAATFSITINSASKAASFLNQAVTIAFQAANSAGVVADFVPLFTGVVKRVVFNESDKAYTLSGYDYGGVHQIPGERISSDITTVLDGTVWVGTSGTISTGHAPIWGVTYTGSDEIIDGVDYFVDTLNGEILVPISSNFLNTPGVLSYKYSSPFSTLKAMMENIAALKGWSLTEDGVTLVDYSTPAKQPVLSVSDESVIDIIRKFLELSGAKCETNLFPSMRIYSEVENLTGGDNHMIDESIYYEDSLSFSISFEELLNEQTVRSVGKTFANIEIGASETLASESGSLTTELLYDVVGYTDLVIPALQPKVIAEVRITKANINSISHTAGGTFIHLFGSATSIQDSDWVQTEEGNEIVFRLTVQPKVDVFTLRTIVSYSGADWTLTLTGTKIEYGEGTIEQTVEVTSTRALTGVSDTLKGDVYENPYIETAAHAGNCANAILTEFGNVYEMSCEVPLHEAATYQIGDKINVERSSSVIFKGIIKSLNYRINTDNGRSPVGLTAKGVGFNI